MGLASANYNENVIIKNNGVADPRSIHCVGTGQGIIDKMKREFYKSLFYVGCAFAVSSTALGDVKNPVVGLGNASCSEYLNVRKEEQGKRYSARFFTWAQGYLNGINMNRISDGKRPKYEVPVEIFFLKRVDRVCEANLELDFVTALNELVKNDVEKK